MKNWLSGSFSRRHFLTLAGMAAAAAACGKAEARLVELAAAVKEKKDRPVVVIGAGLGGLTAAAYLVRAGFPVTVVEQHDVPGGYATSFDRLAGRYTFEVSLHQTAATGTITEQILRELGLWGKVPLVPVPELARIITPDFDLTLPAANPQGCIEVLAKQFPQEKQGIAAFINEMLEISRETNSLPVRMGLWDYVTFPIRHSLLWDIRKLTLAQMLDRHVKDPKLKSLLSLFWGYYGLPPSELSGFYYAVATASYLKHGGYYYQPRAQALSNALADMIQAKGGEVIFETETEGILLKDDAVSGVRLKGGKILPAKAVIAGGSAPDLFGKMLAPQALPADYQAKLASYRPSISSFLVWLGLKEEIRGRITGYGVSLKEGYDPEAEYQACLAADAAKVSLGVALYDNLFAGYSKPGTSTLAIIFTCGYQPWRRFEADYLAGRKKAYHQEKNRLARILVERVEKRLIPGLSGMIEVMEAATPLTNLRYTKNPQGAIYGYEQSVANAFMDRIKERTPVKGLYLASAWGNPGGGYTGVQIGGRNAFMKLMEDWAD